MNPVLWRPSAERVAEANMTRFIRFAARETGAAIADYASLHAWSIRRPQEFWAALWRFCGIRASRPWDSVVEGYARMPGARWFPGTRMNYAENLMRRTGGMEALVFWNENGRQGSLTFDELHAQVRGLAAALRSWGLAAGDRVAGYLPNMPETVVAMLAATALGAVWSSCSPEFGLQGILDRFGQIAPKVLFAADGYQYNGTSIDCLERIRGIARAIPSIERIVLVPYLQADLPGEAVPGAVRFDDCLEPQDRTPFFFEQLPFDHPVYILYTSGTTGAPKCIVHGGGGTLIQHQKEHVLHADIKEGDRIFYYTTCGWMMWNWLVSGLAAGATLVLYDGSPFFPRAHRLWDVAEREQLTLFGTSARYLAALEKARAAPGKTHDLSLLRTVLSTGSPLAPESFDYVYREIKQDVCLSSISGGTDIVASFAAGNPIGPVRRGELQVRSLGMRVEVYDDAGNPVTGRKGELVCTAPFPSMPLGFWNDADQKRYLETYFERFPAAWWHGDYAELTEEGGMIIYGRSDATLNPGGVRIGTAEIYREVEKYPEVLESLVVGQNWRGDVRIVLFVKLLPGAGLDEGLIEKIRSGIRRNLSPRHVPAKVVAVSDIPRTISGKIVELAVRNVIHGRPVKNRDALANPEALEIFENIPELQN